MNKRIYIATSKMSCEVLDTLRVRLESASFYDAYGSDELVDGEYGFSTVVPDGGSKLKSMLRFLMCGYVFIPCGWQGDSFCRKCMVYAEFFGKRLIFEEDWRCR